MYKQIYVDDDIQYKSDSKESEYRWNKKHILCELVIFSTDFSLGVKEKKKLYLAYRYWLTFLSFIMLKCLEQSSLVKGLVRDDYAPCDWLNDYIIISMSEKKIVSSIFTFIGQSGWTNSM